jgi:hypothetical protein
MLPRLPVPVYGSTSLLSTVNRKNSIPVSFCSNSNKQFQSNIVFGTGTEISVGILRLAYFET